MRENGTDRDIALKLVEAVSDCNTLIAAINTNLYEPSITTQPEDKTITALNQNVTFAVVAVHALSYQWQYKTTGEWSNATSEGSDTASWTFSVTTTAIFARSYRCKITGLDGTIIYTDTVKLINEIPEPEPEG